MIRICSVPGCGKPHYGRGLCDLHRDPPAGAPQAAEARPLHYKMLE